MAAPTVGAVMADILPYLGVERHYPEGDAAGIMIELEDLRGIPLADAEKRLRELGLEYRTIGSGEAVADQIPEPGRKVAGDSQVLLYLDEQILTQKVTVPDFAGLTKQQSALLAGSLGLLLRFSGNQEDHSGIVAVNQQPEPNTVVDTGTTVVLQFTDNTARD